jgi:hypothetical protein
LAFAVEDAEKCASLLAGKDLTEILNADPLGQIDSKVRGQGATRLKKGMKVGWFFLRHRKILFKIRALPDQSGLRADTEEGIRESAAALGVSEQAFKNYHADAMKIMELMSPDLDVEQIQAEGKRLIQAALGEPISSRAALEGEGVKIVFYSGPMCSWCDYVKPTFALLSPHLQQQARVFYSEDRGFGKSEGVVFYPMLVAYGPNGRIFSQAYFSNSGLLWERLVLLIKYAKSVSGDHAVNLRGSIKALAPGQGPQIEDVR